VSVEKPGPECDHGPAQRQNRKKAQGVCRLRRLEKVDPAELVRPLHLGRPDHAKVFRRHSSNAGEPEARKASDLQDPVEQTNRAEQKEQHRRQLWRVYGRRTRNVGARRRGVPVRRNVHGKVSRHKIRQRSARHR
jgi:hypothetical protein